MWSRRTASLIAALLVAVTAGGWTIPVTLHQSGQQTQTQQTSAEATPKKKAKKKQAKKPAEATVYVTRTGSKYHRDGCQYLRKSSIPMKLSEAKQGYTPC